MRALGAALALVGIWLSGPLLLAVPAGLLADGTRGLFLPVALALGGMVAMRLLVETAGTRPEAGPQGPGRLAARRWRAVSGGVLAPLLAAEALAALLFLWAQLAAVRELAAGAAPGLPVTLGLAVLAALAGAWSEETARRASALAGALLLGGLTVPLVAVMAVTTSAWPGVWASVASRTELVFPAGSSWTSVGGPARGRTGEAALVFRDEQRVGVVGRGTVRVQPWEGGELSREVAGALELTLRPGDRLLVPPGIATRFQPGRRIPGGPATGPDWVDPPGRRPGWRDLVGLSVTLLAGALGLGPAHVALGGLRPSGSRAALALAATGTALGMITLLLWTLYAAWLMPEVYVGGTAGVRVYGLPEGLLPLREIGSALSLAALAGVGAGAVGAASLAARAFAGAVVPVTGGSRLPALGAVLLALGLAAVAPVDPWPLALAAFGLAAAAAAPAVLMTVWSERATISGVAAGAAAGLVVYAILAVLGLGRGSAGPRAGAGWTEWLVAWPAVAALPAGLLVAWLLRSRRSPSSRGPRPPGLDELFP